MTALYTGLRAGQAVDRCLAGEDGIIEEYDRRLESIHEAYGRISRTITPWRSAGASTPSGREEVNPVTRAVFPYQTDLQVP